MARKKNLIILSGFLILVGCSTSRYIAPSPDSPSNMECRSCDKEKTEHYKKITAGDLGGSVRGHSE